MPIINFINNLYNTDLKLENFLQRWSGNIFNIKITTAHKKRNIWVKDILICNSGFRILEINKNIENIKIITTFTISITDLHKLYLDKEKYHLINYTGSAEFAQDFLSVVASIKPNLTSLFIQNFGPQNTIITSIVSLMKEILFFANEGVKESLKIRLIPWLYQKDIYQQLNIKIHQIQNQVSLLEKRLENLEKWEKIC